jgi:hypothetical protein
MSRVIVSQSRRHDEQMSAMLDRFQAIRWEELASLRALGDTTDQGGFLSPDDQVAEAQAVELDDQQRWSPTSRLRRTQELSKEEQALLAEDFPEDYPSREPEITEVKS